MPAAGRRTRREPPNCTAAQPPPSRRTRSDRRGAARQRSRCPAARGAARLERAVQDRSARRCRARRGQAGPAEAEAGAAGRQRRGRQAASAGAELQARESRGWEVATIRIKVMSRRWARAAPAPGRTSGPASCRRWPVPTARTAVGEHPEDPLEIDRDQAARPEVVDQQDPADCGALLHVGQHGDEAVLGGGDAPSGPSNSAWTMASGACGERSASAAERPVRRPPAGRARCDRFRPVVVRRLQPDGHLGRLAGVRPGSASSAAAALLQRQFKRVLEPDRQRCRTAGRGPAQRPFQPWVAADLTRQAMARRAGAARRARRRQVAFMRLAGERRMRPGSGAGCPNRTDDLPLTRRVLYQLS